MSDLWEDDGDLSAFALPDDEKLVPANSETEQAPAAENAEEAPAAEEQPQTGEDETDRPRGPDGKFVAKEQSEEAPADGAEPPPELILGKFKSVDDVVEAYQNLEREKSRLANEVGDLRPLQEQLQQIQERLPQPATPQFDADQAADYFAEHPAQILPTIQTAYKAGNREVVYAGIRAMEDVDPILAEGLRIEVAKQDALAEMTPLVADSQKATAAQEQAAQVRALTEEIPDIAEFVQGTDIAALVQEFPLVGDALLGDDSAKQADALKTLYHLHRGRLGDNLKDATREAARATAEEAQKARDEAFVASASATAGTAKLTPAEQAAAQWTEYDDPLKDGWNV